MTPEPDAVMEIGCPHRFGVVESCPHCGKPRHLSTDDHVTDRFLFEVERGERRVGDSPTVSEPRPEYRIDANRRWMIAEFIPDAGDGHPSTKFREPTPEEWAEAAQPIDPGSPTVSEPRHPFTCAYCTGDGAFRREWTTREGFEHHMRVTHHGLPYEWRAEAAQPIDVERLARILKLGNIGCEGHSAGATHLVKDHHEDAEFIADQLARLRASDTDHAEEWRPTPMGPQEMHKGR